MSDVPGPTYLPPFILECEPHAADPGEHPQTGERFVSCEQLETPTTSDHQWGLLYRFATESGAFVEGRWVTDHWVWEASDPPVVTIDLKIY